MYICAFSSIQFSPLTDWIVRGTWRTIQQRSSSSLFLQEALVNSSGTGGMSTLWCCWCLHTLSNHFPPWHQCKYDTLSPLHSLIFWCHVISYSLCMQPSTVTASFWLLKNSRETVVCGSFFSLLVLFVSLSLSLSLSLSNWNDCDQRFILSSNREWDSLRVL